MDEEVFLLTIPQTARKLNCGRTKVYELINEKKIKSVKLGKLHRILPASVKHYIKQLAE